MMVFIAETWTVKIMRAAKEHGPVTLVIKYTRASGKMINSMDTENFLTSVHCKLRLAKKRIQSHTT